MTARTLAHADPPFAPGPTTRFYCPVPVLETTFEAMVLATVGRRPVTLLVGPPGAGKTTLLQRLINHWSESGCLLLAVVAQPGMDVEAIVRAGTRDTGVQASGLDDLVETLEGRLDESGAGLLVVDDAHRLSPDVLAELVELSASRTDAGHYVQIVMGGVPALAEALADAIDEPLDAVAAVCTIPPVPGDQIADMIRHRLAVVGEQDGRPFTGGAINALAEAARGRPGAAVTLAATVLDTADARGAERIDAAAVRDILAPAGAPTRRPKPTPTVPRERSAPAVDAGPPPPTSAPAAWQASGSAALAGGPPRPRRDIGSRPRASARIRGGRWTTLLIVLLLAAGGAWAGVEYAERIGLSLPGTSQAPPAARSDVATTVPIAPIPPPPPAAPVEPPAPPAPPTVAAPPQPDPREGRIRSLAQRADRQIEQKRLTTPPGDNALDTVREIEGLIPEHESAARLRAQIADTYVRWGRQAEARRQVDDARRFYGRAVQAKPDDPALRELLAGLDGRGRTQSDETAAPVDGGSGTTAESAALPPPATGADLPSFVQPIDFIGPEALIEALDKPDILRAVIGAGRNFDRPLPDGRTPLMVAAATGRIPAMRILMDEARVGVDRRDPAGWTALMYAAASGQAEAARVLLAAGADRSLRNNAGRSADDLGLAAPRGPMNLSQRR